MLLILCYEKLQSLNAMLDMLYMCCYITYVLYVSYVMFHMLNYICNILLHCASMVMLCYKYSILNVLFQI